MAGRLEGKRALVTGAGQGIGRAVAEAFVREGAIVHAIDSNASAIETISDARAHMLDVRDRDAIAQLAATIETPDIILNAAAYVHVGTILDCTPDAWRKSFEVNVEGVHNIIQAFLPGMIARNSGVITNVASTGGSIKAVADRYVYATTKAAVIGLTKAVAIDFVDKGIRSNAICPGTIRSPSLVGRIEAVAEASGLPAQDVEASYAARQAMGRLGRPEEIAGLAVFLCSDEASFCTGQCYIADGGVVM